MLKKYGYAMAAAALLVCGALAAEKEKPRKPMLKDNYAEVNGVRLH